MKSDEGPSSLPGRPLADAAGGLDPLPFQGNMPLSMPAPTPFEPRAVCARCRRPERVCYCRYVTPIETVTRIVLLQHPRERDVAIGTARMASLCLPSSELHVGVDWEGSPALLRALSDPARPPALLYPGEGAIDIAQSPPSGPITLVVVDGTWSQTKTLVRHNPRLAALPRYAFVPPAPSEYRIRREPRETYVSTIEALVHVLGVLEGAPERFAALLLPFRAMVDMQIEHERRFHGGRLRRAQRNDQAPRRPLLPDVLRQRAGDLVCVIGEANAWPFRAAMGSSAYPDELVQWVACRLSTGEVFERVIAPVQPLGPNTMTHTRLSAERLATGCSMAELFAAWNAFVRDTDVLCSWGHHAKSLFAGAGGALPREQIDMRPVARAFAKGRVGPLPDLAARFSGAQAPASLGAGRAGVRLGQLAAVARHLVAVAALDDQQIA